MGRKRIIKYINKPFQRLPLKLRACFILYVAGFTYRQIQQLGIASPRTISKSIKMGKDEE